MGFDALQNRLDELSRLFDLDQLSEVRCGPVEIERYYRVSRHAYSRYHDRGNAVHMGLSESGSFHPEDFQGQAKFVSSRLPEAATTILELATGRGMNSIWLARSHPELRIVGVDITPAQLAYAEHDGKDVTNFQARYGDFHDLSAFEDGSQDLVFVVEALCHSDSKERIAREVWRVLRPGGRFIVIDGYRGRPAHECSLAENRALALLARGMTVGSFEGYPAVRSAIISAGFDLTEEHDRTDQILPSLERCDRLARRYLNRPIIARIIKALLPRPLVSTAVSGYLFTELSGRGVFAYWISVFDKPVSA
ncbi:MAG: class I SAM-dependent methyltransferase [Pseudomonadota bacterium]